MSNLKKRVQRISPDYFRHRDPLSRLKLMLAGIAAIICGGWIAAEAFSSFSPWRDRGIHTNPSLYSRGGLAEVHSAWNDRCEVCHDPFVPISAQADWMGSLVSSATNERCEACHRGAVHHPAMVDKNMQCSSCHHDHRGRNASLVETADSKCVECHGNLDVHRIADAGSPPSAVDPTIRTFAPGHGDASHPEFRSLEKDPGQIYFNHFVHMSPKEKGSKLWELNRMIADPKDRARYERFIKDGVVQLDCDACHVVEAEDFDVPRSDFHAMRIPNTREHRAYMAPIRYDNQCRACHPTNIGVGDVSEPIPHGIQPPEVEQYLVAFFGGDRQQASRTLTRIFVPPTSETRSFQGCARCHSYEVAPGSDRPDKIEPAQIPQVWMPKGMFDHTSHRGVSCDSCHPKARESGKDAYESRSYAATSDVLIEGIENCRKCHAPPHSDEGEPRGGVRDNCVTCHRFHNQGHPMQGLGALAGDALEKRSTAAFLGGEAAPTEVPASANSSESEPENP